MTDKHGFDNWITVDISLYQYMNECGLTGIDYKVFNEIMKLVQKKNIFSLSQREISIKLGIDKNQTSRSIKKLRENLIILQLGRRQQQNLYQLNPLYAWKGLNSDHKKAMAITKKKIASDNIIHLSKAREAK